MLNGFLGWAGYRERVPRGWARLLEDSFSSAPGGRLRCSQSGQSAAILCPPTDAVDACSATIARGGAGLGLVWCGGIWNADELRADLERGGQGEAVTTDADLILRGYLAWGDAVVERLHGEFAFALWDGRGGGRLLLTGDRSGRRPLYFRSEAGGGVSFSSGLGALLRHAGATEVSPEILAHYLREGSVPSGRSMMQGCRRLPAGEMAVWAEGRLAVRSCRSRRPGWPPVGSAGPAGVLLSGGPRSAAVAGQVVRRLAAPPNTYTACLGVGGLKAHDEARRVARALATRHRAIMVNPRCGRLLPHIASLLDEPCAEPLAVAAYLICRRARQEVGVLYSGERVSGCRLSTGVWGAVSRASGVRLIAPLVGPEGTNVALEPSSPRRKKIFGGGRSSVLDDWFRCEWRTLALDVLTDPRSRRRGWWDARLVERTLGEHLAGRRSHGQWLYRLVMLELWARAVLDGAAATIPGAVDDCMRDLPADRPVRKVAVIAPAGIGDTMRLAPAIRQLGRADPSVSVTVYVARGRCSDEVMAGMGPVDRHVQIDFDARGLGKVFALVRDLRRNRPDELASAWVSTVAGLAGWLSGVRRRSGWVPRWSRRMRMGGLLWRRRATYDPPTRDAGMYDTRAFAALLGLGRLEDSAPRFSAPIWEERALVECRRVLGGLDRPVLAVSPAAGPRVPQREYPMEKMGGVLAALLEQGAVGSVALFGDAAARRRTEPLARRLGSRCVDFAGRLGLSSSVALMRECDAALVVDGALLHAALASDLPVVALYGPTQIYSTDPRGEPGRYACVSAFERCTCRCLPHRGIKASPQCRERPECLGSIPPETVVRAVAGLLGKAAPVAALSTVETRAAC